ncbi:MAG: thiamine pyrophosphate-dependent enzyme, partial [Acidimicrobiia bacterium]
FERNEAIHELSQRLSAPIFADPQTNLSGGHVISHGDLVVAVNDDQGSVAMAAHPPDIVVRIGPIPTSQPMWRWLESSKADQILIHESRLSDPLRSADRTFDGDLVTSLNGISSNGSRDNSYLESWLLMDQAVDLALAPAIALLPFPNEPLIARSVVASVPPRTGLVVASSRPIRDVDAFATPRSDVDILANRGVNGIDGTISTALGVATAGMPATLLIGDVAALHDIGCLAEVARHDADLRIIVVNNDGGGIFSFLPQARSEIVEKDVYERHWGTPHGLDLAVIAGSMGIRSNRLESLAELEAAVSAPIAGPELFEVLTDRSTVLDHHSSILDAVSGALIEHVSTGS